MNFGRVMLVLVFAWMALRPSLPADSRGHEHRDAHVIAPHASDANSHSHGHKHSKNTPEHDHGTFGDPSDEWTIPTRTAALADGSAPAHALAIVSDRSALPVSAKSDRPRDRAPNPFDSPPREFSSVLLI